MLAARVEVEQDHEPVVEALPADAPLVHQRLSVAVGLVGRDPVVADLAVDDDLGTGPGFDRVDRRLGVRDRLLREHAGLVVDRAVGLGVRERRPGGDAVRGGLARAAAATNRSDARERGDDPAERLDRRRTRRARLERRADVVADELAGIEADAGQRVGRCDTDAAVAVVCRRFRDEDHGPLEAPLLDDLVGNLRRLGVRIVDGPVAVTGDDDHVDVVELRHEVDELVGRGEKRLAEQAVVVNLLTLDAVRWRIGGGHRGRDGGQDQGRGDQRRGKRSRDDGRVQAEVASPRAAHQAMALAGSRLRSRRTSSAHCS